MFNPMQSQAALQNKARFPDQKLQQYASGRPPQPTGQVTPPMAGGELAQRGADRQAFQNEAAMQADPSGRPPVLAEKAMQLQQQEQQLGMLAAMLAKKQQDLAAREQGIGALPIRPDMFTAMDGGIVFSGGGGVKGYAGPDGLSLVRGNIDDEARALDQLRVDRILGERKRKEDLERLEFLERVAPEAAEKMLRDNPSLRPSAPSTIESSAPSTTKDDKKGGDKKVPSTTGTTSLPNLGGITSGLYDKYMGRMAPYMATPSEVAEARSGIAGSLGRVSSAAEQARPLEGKAREEMEQGERERLAKEYGEYAAGRTGRREKVAEALRGQKPELIDYLGAMAEGGPGKTLAETLSRAVPGTTKLRAEQKAREMAAAKFMAEAEELDAKADLAERRGQTTAARAFSDQADQRRARGFEITERAEKATMQGLGALAQSAMEESKRNVDIVGKGAGAELEAEFRTKLEQAKMAYEAGKPTELMRNVKDLAKLMGVSEREAFALIKPPKSDQKRADPAKALEAVRAIPFNDPMLIGRAGLTADEMMKLGRSKTYEELPPVIQRKLNRVREAMYQQMTTGAADASLYE